MVAHHRETVGEVWPVRDEGAAWQRRRAEYLEWVAGEGTMLAAVPAGDPAAAPLGYAVLMPSPVGATWDLGERIGEVESLSVAPEARGRGVGSALLDAAREHFLAAGSSTGASPWSRRTAAPSPSTSAPASAPTTARCWDASESPSVVALWAKAG